MMDLYVLDGKVARRAESIAEFSAMIEKTDRRVARTEIDAKTQVSTVFLGNDHNFFGDGPPLLFETLVFRDGHGDDATMERYSTWEEAEAGHARAVASESAACATPLRGEVVGA